MTDGEKPPAKQSLKKSACIAAYLLVLVLYAVTGGMLLKMALPVVPLFVTIIVAGIVAAKLDYRFKGLAWKFEQKYVSYMDK